MRAEVRKMRVGSLLKFVGHKNVVYILSFPCLELGVSNLIKYFQILFVGFFFTSSPLTFISSEPFSKLDSE